LSRQVAPPVAGSEKSGTASPTVTDPGRVALRSEAAGMPALRGALRPFLALLMI
jgi:hypothetical protein